MGDRAFGRAFFACRLFLRRFRGGSNSNWSSKMQTRTRRGTVRCTRRFISCIVFVVKAAKAESCMFVMFGESAASIPSRSKNFVPITAPRLSRNFVAGG